MILTSLELALYKHVNFSCPIGEYYGSNIWKYVIKISKTLHFANCETENIQNQVQDNSQPVISTSIKTVSFNNFLENT